MTEIVPTFSLWKREQKKLRAISDTQPEDILVIKSRSFLCSAKITFISCYARTLRTPQSHVLQRVQAHSAHRAVRCRDRYARSSR